MIFASTSILLLLFSACEIPFLGGDSSPENKPGQVTPKSAKKAAEVEEEEAEAEEEYAYNPIGKRDPFRSFLSFATDDGDGDDIARTPLQKYDIAQYRLTGIVWGIDRPRALVEDPENIGHVMELGTYVGKNWGKVTSITENVVVITEEYQTIDGELVVKPIELRLRFGEDSSGI